MLQYETTSGTKVHLKDNSVDVERVVDSVLSDVVDAARPSYEKRDNLANFVLTSGCDGEHSDGSLHYVGLALDLRVWGFSEAEAKRVTEEVQARLGRLYDVIYESGRGAHIHVEYDPRQ